MFNLHFRDGRTERLDLENGTPELLERLGRSDFQDSLTAVTVRFEYETKKGKTGMQFSVPRPEGFHGQHWFVLERIEPEGKIKGGERVTLLVGDIRLVLMVHQAQPAARISVAKVGKILSKPKMNGRRPKSV